METIGIKQGPIAFYGKRKFIQKVLHSYVRFTIEF